MTGLSPIFRSKERPSMCTRSVDWLYPEKMGALFQALAILSRSDKSHAEIASLDNAIRKTFGGLVDILINQSEKGRISPLGSNVHRAIYSELSPAVHQDFGVTQEFGVTVSNLAWSSPCREASFQILQFLNIVVSATIVEDRR